MIDSIISHHVVRRALLRQRATLSAVVISKLHSASTHHVNNGTTRSFSGQNLLRSMVNRYDELERQVGISSYISSHEGFAAVVKARYSDFIVHEGM